MLPRQIFQDSEQPQEFHLDTDRLLVSEIEDAEVEHVNADPHVDDEVSLPASPMTVGPKVKRNDSCPCGSGKKYKLCRSVNKIELAFN